MNTTYQAIVRSFRNLIWPPAPKVGLGVIIVKGGKILIGTRKGSHCVGQKCVPGGHLDYGESIEVGSLREIREETGLVVSLRRFDEARSEWLVVNNILEGKHYVGLFLVADWVSGEPQLKEPKKNYGWFWTEYDVVVKMSKPGCAWLPTELFTTYKDRILKV